MLVRQALVEAVGPALAGKVKVLGLDHNWSLHPHDVGSPDQCAFSYELPAGAGATFTL